MSVHLSSVFFCQQDVMWISGVRDTGVRHDGSVLGEENEVQAD